MSEDIVTKPERKERGEGDVNTFYGKEARIGDIVWLEGEQAVGRILSIRTDGELLIQTVPLLTKLSKRSAKQLYYYLRWRYNW